MGMHHETYQEILSETARRHFGHLLEVEPDALEKAFHTNPAALTEAYYKHRGWIYAQAEMLDKFNRAGLACITVVALPLAIPFMLAMLYTRWTIGNAMRKDKAALRTRILTLST